LDTTISSNSWKSMTGTMNLNPLANNCSKIKRSLCYTTRTPSSKRVSRFRSIPQKAMKLCKNRLKK
jgi:hypothetical protein